MLVNEIGGEFHFAKVSNGHKLPLPNGVSDHIFTFAGRTAIATVLANLSGIHKAILPSYCCDSMIEPFRSAGIEVCFFDVNFSDGLKIDLSIPSDVDLVFWCNYFGFDSAMPDLSHFIKRGGIVVEDITHSFFSESPYHPQSNFLVASLRKWMPILSGGYCASINDVFEIRPKNLPPSDFLKKKREAMKLKSEYISGGRGKKTKFLSLYSDCNAWLAENYEDLRIDKETMEILDHVDARGIRHARVQNAKILYEGLKDNKLIKPLFDEDAMRCPLFVPVVIQNGQRDGIRRKLIENSIYCPIHWPQPRAGCLSNLYEFELSLICDQRYVEKDMKRILSVLCD